MRYQYDAYGWYVGAIDTDEALPFTSSIAPQEQDVVAPEGSDIRPNYIGNGWVWMSYEAPKVQHVEPPVFIDPCKYLIDNAAFTDRIMAFGYIIDLIDDPIVQVFSKDLNRRKYIDLTDQRVISFVRYLSGSPVAINGTELTITTPILTEEQTNSILTDPVLAHENSALRKAYFS